MVGKALDRKVDIASDFKWTSYRSYFQVRSHPGSTWPICDLQFERHRPQMRTSTLLLQAHENNRMGFQSSMTVWLSHAWRHISQDHHTQPATFVGQLKEMVMTRQRTALYFPGIKLTFAKRYNPGMMKVEDAWWKVLEIWHVYEQMNPLRLSTFKVKPFHLCCSPTPGALFPTKCGHRKAHICQCPKVRGIYR